MDFRLLLTFTAVFAITQQACAQDGADPSLVERGSYLAAASDCSSCHGADFKGGDPVASPIGKIYASNITSDKSTGIGNWTLQQFSDALRKGKSPHSYLYPAMPYTSYTAMKDEDVQAIYSYMMLQVPPVSNRPSHTTLPFPFFRPAMAFWNLLFLKQGQAPGNPAQQQGLVSRGHYLVETLGHCSVCHTPRGDLMQELPEKHLGGALTSGWWAPNITPDKSGIGGWSDAQLATFLTTGRNDVAAAGGEMGRVVSNSLSKLTPDDIAAIVAYLKSVPAVAGLQPPRKEAAPANQPIGEPTPNSEWQSLISHDTQDGATIFQAACASCHGKDGNGSRDQAFISLHSSSAVASPHSANLVQAIANGIQPGSAGKLLMPAFGNDLAPNQIAAVSNYVASNFGGIATSITDKDVTSLLKGEAQAPSWIIQNAAGLAIAAVAVAIILLLLLVWALARSFGVGVDYDTRQNDG